DAGKLGAVAYAFDGHQYHVGVRVVGHEFREVEHVEIGLVTAAHLVADVEAQLVRSIHHVDLPEAAALRDQSDIACRLARSGQRGGRSHAEDVHEAHEAVAVGAHDANVAAADDVLDPLFKL